MAQEKRRANRGANTSTPQSASRRQFLKGGAVAGLGGAAVLAGLGTQEVSAQGITWDREADVVIIGSGGAGLPASIAARDLGVSVLIVEQNFDIGGMSINSGALIQLGCGNKYQKAAGIEDTPDQFFKEWTRTDHPHTRYNDREIVRTFADNAVATFDFLTENGVKWARLSTPQGASMIPRTVQAAPWPKREEQPTRGNNGGSGYARSLEKTAKAKGVEFLMQHRMTKIHREKPNSGRVIGLSAIPVDKLIQPMGGPTVNIRARKGVIVATGGHSGNVNFRRMYDPRLTEEYSAHCGLCNPKNADGELAGMAIGAALWTMAQQTRKAEVMEGTSMGTRFNGGARFPPESNWFVRAKASGLMAKDYQDVILVKENGKRFWDETMTPDPEARRLAAKQKLPYDNNSLYYAAALEWTGDPKKLNGGGPIWAIFDSAAVEREGWKMMYPYVEDNYYFKADTLEELAAKIKNNPYQWREMPGQALRETVERYNSFVDSGVDKDFRKPTPLYKISTPPFYAMWQTPNPNDCHSGLRINTNAQVLDMNGEIIPGLYAAGDSASGILFHGIGKASLFGRLAGIHAAKQVV